VNELQKTGEFPSLVKAITYLIDGRDYPSWPGTTVRITKVRLTQYQAERGFQTILKFRITFFANPSPEGRGCREAAGEGYSDEETSKKNKK
jgi:hypothetical protein